MTSSKNKRATKLTFENVEDDNVQLTEGANVSPYGASQDHSPTPTREDSGTEDEVDPASLMLILKELRGVGKEVKEFRKDTKV